MFISIFSHLRKWGTNYSDWPFVHILILLLSITILSSQEVAAQERPELTDMTKVKVQEEYGRLPLYFIQNNGQVDEKVKFYEKGNGRTTFFTKEGVYISLTNIKQTVNSMRHEPSDVAADFSLRPTSESGKIAAPLFPSPHRGKGQGEGDHNLTSEIVKLTFLDANTNPEIIAEDVQEGKVNYFIGNDPAKWRTNISTFKAVVYKEVYPGIDVKFYGNNRQMEYDIIVKPGADPAKVRFAYEGIRDLKVADNGDLEIVLKEGSIIQKKPVIYQEIDGKRLAVDGRFVIVGGDVTSVIASEAKQSQILHSPLEGEVKGEGDSGSLPAQFAYAFEVASYDRGKPLIIDPAIAYSTYLGGNSTDAGYEITVDTSGSVYVTGPTSSSNFPTTIGVYDRTWNSGLDVFVLKLHGNGSTMIYSTYIGGSSDDYGYSITVDASGDAYLTGLTLSSNFPVTSGVHDTISNGSYDVFVTKLNGGGSTLLYSTYFGGNGWDIGYGIKLDAFGNAYVTGQTLSSNFPTTLGAYDRIFNGSSDAFVAKLDGSGSSLAYSTFIGGNADDFGYSMVVDDAGDVYVTGSTTSSNFPVIFGAYDTTFNGSSDVFVAKLNGNGSSLLNSTYLGGSGNDACGCGIAIDTSGNIYVTGMTSSSNFPATSGAYDITFNGANDVFVAKLDGAGSALVYSTYIGGSADDISWGVSVDTLGNAYLEGQTSSSNFPTTPGTYDSTSNGLSDAFVVKLDGIGSSLLYSTYIGGSGDDYGYGLAVDAKGNAYITGQTSSSNFPTTTGAYDTTFNGTSDIFVLKLAFQPLAELPRTGQTTCYDSSGTVISCADTGQDGEIRAGIPWPNPRFIDHGNGSVTDNLTGLMWTKSANLPGTYKTWQEALNYVAGMNAGTYPNFGYTDWRLPNIVELESLIDVERSVPALHAVHPFTSVQGMFYWSSTSYADFNSDAWIVYMSSGYVAPSPKSSSYYVWPVRSGQNKGSVQLPKTGQTISYSTDDDGGVESGVPWPVPRFIDHGNGNVTDNLTGLMWTKNAHLPGAYKTWQQALDYVKGMNVGTYPNFGYTDWRLPNRKELQSLIDHGVFNPYGPAFPVGHPFTNVQGNYYWSSTSYAGTNSVWYVFMRAGSVGFWNKSNISSLWPVRSGQVGPLVHSIIGRVTENSVGLGGVTMTISAASSAATSTTSDGTYSFTGLSDGDYTITPSLNSYTFNPTSISVTVAGSDVTGVNFTASPVNRPPVLDTIGPKSVNEGSLLSFSVSGSDPDGDPLTFSASGLPPGATFDSTAQTFSWTPDYTQEGLYSVTCMVSDGSLSDSGVVPITVNNVNLAPVLDPIGNQTIAEGVTLNMAITASDPDGGLLTLNTTGLPGFCEFTDNGNNTGTLSCNPGYGDAGTYTGITFSASDGSLTDSETITLTVNNVNQAPILNPIGSKFVNEGELLSFVISGSDPDGDPVAFGTQNLPLGATFDPLTRTFSWTPDYNDAGVYQVTFTLDDITNALSTSKTITITVNQRDAFVTNDIAGNWRFHLLTAGDSPQWLGWTHGVMDIDSNGDFNATVINRSDGDSTNLPQGTFSVSADGTVSMLDNNQSFHGVMSTDTTTIVGTMSDGGGGYDLLIFQRSDASISLFSQADLTGNWYSHLLTSGDSPQFVGWAHWDMGIDGAGNCEMSNYLNSSGDTSQNSTACTMNVGSDGVVSFVDSPSFHAVMSLDKNTIVGTMDDGGGGYDLFISQRSGGDFAQSDLAGAWHLHGLLSGDAPQRSGWVNGDFSIDASGGYTASATFSYGVTESFGGAFPVNANGVLSEQDNPYFHGTMGINKDIMVFTHWNGEDGYMLGVMTKSPPAGTTNNSSIQGTVTDNGIGIGGVTMILSGGASATTATATDGTYNFTGLGVGTFTVTPLLPGVIFSPSSITIEILSGGAQATNMDFELVGPPVISRLNPDSGTEGTLVWIFGSDFGATIDNTIVTFNGVEAIIIGSGIGAPGHSPMNGIGGIGYEGIQISGLEVLVPSGATTGPVAVTVNGVSSNTDHIFTVTTVNSQPVLDPVGAKTIDEGALLHFIVSGSDPDNDTLTFSADGLPGGAAFDPITGAFSYTPDYDVSNGGTDSFFDVLFSVNDGEFTATETVRVTVYNVNRAPSLNPIGDKTVAEGLLLTFTISGSDPDNDVLTFNANGHPAGAVLDPATGTFTYTPDFDVSNRISDSFFDVYFSVSDGGQGGRSSETVRITVSNVNRVPILNAVGTKSVSEGTQLTFAVDGSDPEGDALTFDATGLPAGATFDPETKTFSFTPDYDTSTQTQDSFFDVFFSVSDGLLTDSEDVIITVSNVNRAPVLSSIGAKSVDEGTQINFTVSGSDPDGDPLTFSAAGLPSGAGFDPVTKSFSWTPGYVQAGNYTVTFGVNDGIVSDSEEVLITVNNVNLAPILNPIGNQSVNEGTILNLTVIAGDLDGDLLSLSTDGLPPLCSFVDHKNYTGTFTCNPGYNDAGTYTGLTFTVSDGVLTDSETMTLTVNDINGTPAANAGSDKIVVSGSAVTLNGHGNDPEGDTVTFIWTQTGGPLVTLNNADTTTPTFVTPAVSQGGETLTFELTVSDGIYSGTDTVNVTVVNETDLQYLPFKITDTIPSEAISQGSSFFTSEFFLDFRGGPIRLASDIQGTGVTSVDDVLSINVVHDDGTRSVFNHDYSPACTGVNTEAPVDLSPYIKPGINHVVVDLRDNCGVFVGSTELWLTPYSGVVELTAEAGSNRTANEGDVIEFDGTGSADTPGNTIVKYLWDFGDGIRAEGVNVHHAYGDNGVYTVTLVVADDRGYVAWDTATITVLNVAPTVKINATPSVLLGPDHYRIYYDEQPITFTATVNEPGSKDIATLRYEWNLGDGTPISNQVSHIKSYVVTETEISKTFLITLTVQDDDGGTGSDSIQLTVRRNQIPQIDQIIMDPPDVYEGQTTVRFSARITDDGTIEAYQWEFGDGATDKSESPTHTYANNAPGADSYTVRLIALDDGLLTAYKARDVRVLNVPPTVSISPDRTIVPVNVPIHLSGRITDPAGMGDAPFDYQWGFGDGGESTASESNFAHEVSHQYNEPGTYEVNLAVTDRDGGTGDAVPVSISVCPAGEDPVALIREISGSFIEGSKVSFDGSSSYDPEGCFGNAVWTFGDGEKAFGLNQTHVYSNEGSYWVTLTVSDSYGQTATAFTAITIENACPTVRLGPDRSGAKNKNLSFSSSSYDPGTEDGLTYTWDFGDGSQPVTGIDISSIKHSYNALGSYEVKVKLTDGVCEVEDSLWITINENEIGTASEYFDISIEPDSMSLGLGEPGSYKVILKNNTGNPGTVELNIEAPSGIDVAIEGISGSSVVLAAGQTKDLPLNVGISCNPDLIGEYIIRVAGTFVSSQMSDADTAEASLTVLNRLHLGNLIPEDRALYTAVDGTAGVLVAWETNIDATTEVLYRRQDQDTFSSVNGPTGREHQVTISNLTPGVYHWKTRSVVEGCSDVTSQERVFTVLGTGGGGVGACESSPSGVNFTNDRYDFYIGRDYDIRLPIAVENRDDCQHSINLEVLNKPDGMPVNFVPDEDVTVSSGEHNVSLVASTFGPAGEYFLRGKLSAYDNPDQYINHDYALIVLHVQDETDRCDTLEFSQLTFDQETITGMYRIINNGDKTVPDLRVYAEESLAPYLLIEPQINNVYLKPGEAIEFNARFISSDGVVPFGGNLIARSVNGSCPGVTAAFPVVTPPPPLFKITVPSPHLCFDKQDWYCTNEGVKQNAIEIPFSLPAGFDRSDVNSALLYVTFILPLPPSSYEPHDVVLAVNGHHIGSLQNTVPQGVYAFEIPTSYLNTAQSGVASNIIRLEVQNFNEGLYLVASKFKIIMDLKQITLAINAETYEDAERIKSRIISQPPFCDGEPGMDLLPKFEAVQILDDEGAERVAFRPGERVRVIAHIENKDDLVRSPVIHIALNSDPVETNTPLYTDIQQVTVNPGGSSSVEFSWLVPADLSPGTYRISLKMTADVTGEVCYDCQGYNWSFNVVIPENTVSISGTVAEDGIGMGGVTIALTGLVSVSTSTATDGTYSFIGIADGSYTITPSLSNYIFTPGSRSVTISGTDATGIDFAATALSDCSTVEICDGIDNDCNGDVDEGFTLVTFYKDQDNDGYGDPDQPINACSIPIDYVDNPNDKCPYDPKNDIDSDGVCGDIDNCLNLYNKEQEDFDNDGIGDLCDFDLTVTGIEVTQAIQYDYKDVNNNIPLVANKKTWVRVFIDLGLPYTSDIIVKNVTAQLVRTNSDGSIMICDSDPCELSPSPAYIDAEPLWIVSPRDDVSQTINFELPSSWTKSGTINLKIIASADSEPKPYQDNNEFGPVVREFYEKESLNVMFVPVVVKKPNSETYCSIPEAEDFIATSKWVSKSYPISRLNMWQSDVLKFDVDGDIFNNEILWELWGATVLIPSLVLTNLLTEDPVTNMKYYGLVCKEDDLFPDIGMAFNTDIWRGNEAWGTRTGESLIKNPTFGGHTMAHEIGHLFARKHAPCGNPDDPDSEYPQYGNYKSGSIGEFGFDGEKIYDPVVADDFMSYCPQVWVSPYTYNSLFNEFN